MWKDVIEVSHCGGHVLRLRFEDGVEGTLDLAKQLRFTGVFAPLEDPGYFAPDVLYELVRAQHDLTAAPGVPA